jgi:hypothetical protein
MRRVFALLLLAGWLCTGTSLKAQNPPSAPAPATSSTQTKPATSATTPDNQSKVSPPAQSPPIPAAGDIFYAPLATSLEKQSFEEKLHSYAIVTFGPRALVAPALSAAILMARPPKAYPHDWRDGAGAFGRNYGSSLATGASLRTGRFWTGALLHEDFRYRPSTSWNPLARSFHAVAFTFVDKSDSGHNRLALANLIGAAAGGFVGELYLPPGYSNLSHAETRTAAVFGALAGQNLLREFAPEILRTTRKLHVPFPRIPVPAWWGSRKG